MTYKFIAKGLKKFTAIAKAIQTWADFDSAVAEADSAGEPYFIEHTIDGFCKRAIAWANKATKGLDKGAWEHRVPTTIDELEGLVAAMPVDTPTTVFKLAYAQYCIKMDSLAVKPKGAGAGYAKEIALFRNVYDRLIAAKKTPEEIDATMEIMLTGLPYANKVAEALKLGIQFS